MCSKLYRLPVRRGFDSRSGGHGGRLFCAECGARSERRRNAAEQQNAATRSAAFVSAAFVPAAFISVAFVPVAFVPAAFVPVAFISAEFVPAECIPVAFVPAAFISAEFVPVEHNFSTVNSLFGRARRHRFIRTSPKGCSERAFRSHRAAMKYRGSLKPSAAYSLFIRRPWEQHPSFW